MNPVFGIRVAKHGLAQAPQAHFCIADTYDAGGPSRERSCIVFMLQFISENPEKAHALSILLI